MRRLKIVSVLFVTLLTSHGVADDIDQDRAQALRNAGEILPLENVLKIISEQQPGRILDVELELEDGFYVYEIETIDNQGAVFEWYVDARTGKILKREQEH